MARRLSIGARWTLRYMAAMLVTLSVFSLYIYHRVEQRIESSAKLVLRMQLAELQEVVEDNPDDPAAWEAYARQHMEAAQGDLRIGIRIFDAAGQLRVAMGSLDNRRLPRQLERTDAGVQEVDLGDSAPYVVGTRPAGGGHVQAAVYTRTFHRSAARIRDVLLTAVPVMLLIVAVFGWWLSRRSLAPIATITRTARRISGTRLDERIPTTGSGDELDELAGTLNEMMERIRTGMGRIGRFSMEAAHELRTPLAALRSQLDVTLEKERTPEEYRQVLQGLVEQTEQLTRTVDGMLRLAQSEAGVDPGHRQDVRLGPLLEDVVGFFEPLAEEHGVELACVAPGDAHVEGDPVWLHQLFANLVDNALRCTPRGGRVEVRMEAEADSAVVDVCDSGAGVREGDRERIFERFVRGGAAQSSPGAGLGLPLARQIARAHGGSLELERAPGPGATFRVRLPLGGALPA